MLNLSLKCFILFELCFKVGGGYDKEMTPIEARSAARKARVLGTKGKRPRLCKRPAARPIGDSEVPGEALDRLAIVKCRVASSDRPAPRAEVGGFVAAADGNLRKIHLFTLRASMHGAEFRDVAHQLADEIAARSMTKVQALAHRDAKFS